MGISNEIINKIRQSNCSTDETFFQAVEEVLESIQPVLESDSKYNRHSVVDRLTNPDREFKFKVVFIKKRR